MKRRVRLSQCMIVKNEEKNIRRALSWAKDIAFEQIVVDTGSTDRTVEIAEEMGAKVYHFQWIDDFSAAKNYAIDQASGNWIAFLDADEYFTEEDAHKLMSILEQAMSVQNVSDIPHVVRCSWIHLDDAGIPFAVSGQDRIFRHLPQLRYHGRIHEQIAPKSGKLKCLDAQNALSILHTGYTREAAKDTNKAQRNIELLEREVNENPENYIYWSYLGDSYLAAQKRIEAKESYLHALSGFPTENISWERYINAAKSLLKIYSETPELADSMEEILNVAEKAGYPEAENPDIYYFLSLCRLHSKDLSGAYKDMKNALERVDTYKKSDTVYISGNLKTAYTQMAAICQKLDRPQEVVRYGVLALRIERFLDTVLVEILSLLQAERGESENSQGTWGLLSKIYQMDNPKDQLFLYKCAKAVGFTSLKERILNVMSDSLRDEVTRIRAGDEIPEDTMGIAVRNMTDRRFLQWANYIKRASEEELTEGMKNQLAEWRKKAYQAYSTYVEYYGKYNFWGTLDPDHDDYTVFDTRAHMMKSHLEDLVWLYDSLCDYRSKGTLLGILLNWTYLNTVMLGDVKERGEQYFDFDLIPSAEEEVLVDLGAFIGDTVKSFVQMYGSDYKKIYAYEPDRRNAEFLQINAEPFHDIDIRVKGAGKEKGVLNFVSRQESSSSYFTTSSENAGGTALSDAELPTGDPVEIVTLDEDITEPVTWIKMDVEGSEYDAILGSKRHITEEHPKLSVSVYHGYDDLWLLPKLIHSLNPSYRFYLRYYGGNLIPTEIVLTALP